MPTSRKVDSVDPTHFLAVQLVKLSLMKKKRKTRLEARVMGHKN